MSLFQSPEHAVYVFMDGAECTIFVDGEEICKCCNVPLALALYAVSFCVFNLSFLDNSAFCRNLAFCWSILQEMRISRASDALMDKLAKGRRRLSLRHHQTVSCKLQHHSHLLTAAWPITPTSLTWLCLLLAVMRKLVRVSKVGVLANVLDVCWIDFKLHYWLSQCCSMSVFLRGPLERRIYKKFCTFTLLGDPTVNCRGRIGRSGTVAFLQQPRPQQVV